MALCSICKTYVDQEGICPTCGGVSVEVTAFDPKVGNVLSVEPLRPRLRPPTAKLVVVDDDSDWDGEVIRIRNLETLIGRRGCDVLIANDADISASHARIVREEPEPGVYRWYLDDLGSTNGTYLRMKEWQSGSGIDFFAGAVRLHAEIDPKADSTLIVKQILPDKRQQRFSANGTTRLGRADGLCQMCLDDSTVDSVHIEITHAKGLLRIKDLNSQNGTWVRVSHCSLQDGDQFFLGQQRFRFQLPTVSANGQPARNPNEVQP